MKIIKNYVRVASLEEAYELNQKKSNRILGGMMWQRLEGGTIQTAIDLCDLGLNQIEEDEAVFRIGAMVTLRQLELHEGLNRYSSFAVAHAVWDIVGVQFRNMATVGGSIWGRFGFSDVLTVFLAMDCDVELYKGGIIPLREFVKMKRDRDILVRLIVKKTPGHIVYSSVRAAKTDFPILTCAVSDIGGTVKASVGARPAKAVLVEMPNGGMTGSNEQSCEGDSDSNEILYEAFSQYVASNIRTDSNLRGSAAYRKHLTKVLVSRNYKALEELR